MTPEETTLLNSDIEDNSSQEEESTKFDPGETIDNPSQDLIDDLNKAPEVITRSLIPLDNTVKNGRRLGFYSTLVLFMGRMLGSGIFATPGLIFQECQGSYILYLFVWIWATLISYTGLSVFLEVSSFLPVSGGIKKFFNYIFPKPLHLSNFVIGVFNVLFSLSSSNSLVFGEYLLYSLGFTHNEETVKRIACTLLVFGGLAHGWSRNVGVGCQNWLGGVKLLLFTIIVCTCFIVLVLPSSSTGLEKTKLDLNMPPLSTFTGSIYSTAMLKCIHSLGGWTSSIIVSNDIKNPVESLKHAGYLSI
ncbi:unnamed protein product [Ambrosiozyma monospora]|uniref:Unnamed protein product n=1 Tax=Ambrosiozyma monospora TaxID=43982 RepID=A0ACB5U1J1_AMBMO|nr:unnamed protein product [Ambrosiozyma monospora]